MDTIIWFYSDSAILEATRRTYGLLLLGLVLSLLYSFLENIFRIFQHLLSTADTCWPRLIASVK